MLSINSPSESIDGLSTNKDLENISSLSTQDAQGNKKKKNKRSHENDQTTEIDSAQRKKRRKHRDNDQEPVIQESQPIVDKPQQDVPQKPKKRKKGKEKTPASPTDAEIEANSHASAAALLSAIVAASISNPEPSLPMHYDPQAMPQPHQSFVSYPYPFNVSPAFHCDPTSTQAPSVFPSVMNFPGAPFSQLAFGSNEDVLRALQDLDITKIASVLKTLGEAAAAANAPNFASQLSVVPSELQPPPPAVGQVPATSNVILGIPPKQSQPSTSGSKNPLNMSLLGNEQHTNPDHAYLLANKWLNATKLAELVRDEGLVYKKGKFSAIEEQQLKSAIERYQNERQLDESQLLELIFAKNEKSRDNAFWSELTSAVPLRPIVAVYHHVRRSHHPLKLQGQWKEHEDDLLTQAVADLGQQWEKVSFRVGRMASDCRDRYRNHIINREIRVSGHWSKEEEDKLTAIVTDMTVNQGKDIDSDVFWGKVSELMGGKRGRQQCRIKWTDALSKTVKNEGQKPRWSPQDGYILVHKIDSLNVRDDTEIDWKTISDTDWNLWSAHTLQRRWFTLKRSVKGHETMTHQDIMDILRIKKAHLPSPPATSARKRKERKVTSAAAIHDNDGCTAGVTMPEAGSSTGVGTLNHVNVAATEKGDDGDVTGSGDDD